VLITGANKGIGLECVRLLAQQQPAATVLLGARSQRNGEEAVQQLRALGLHNVRPQLIDVDDDASVAAAAAQIEREHGGLTALIANAGVLEPEDTPEAAARVMRTNYWGARRTAELLLPLLPSDGTGRLVLVSSMVSSWTQLATPAPTRVLLESESLTVGELDELARKYMASRDVAAGCPHAELFAPMQVRGSNTNSSYGVSKQLLTAYGRVLARDLAPRSISVFSVCPGYCTTTLNSHAMGPSASNAPTRSPQQGAQSILQALQLPADQSGGLFQDGKRLKIALPVGFIDDNRRHNE